MSARDFAAYIGVSHGTVSNGEGDKHEVRKITINAYAAATGVPVEWLEHGIVVSDPDPDEGKSVDGGSDAVSQLAARKRSRTTRHAEGDTDRYLWAEPAAA